MSLRYICSVPRDSHNLLWLWKLHNKHLYFEDIMGGVDVDAEIHEVTRGGANLMAAGGLPNLSFSSIKTNASLSTWVLF